ncbi:DNA (cytosine-5)-methyltransferase CMT2-like [Cynara cardunculus var. scolymus]|uniref:DNA (cytosine-5)-methyltransferase CMT2-like n=1 Tax=Cynara cardunculus var. scolymus TaxID=59895 RepID=UPI000D62B751|nr:DNA (cytosine-5)-methyltransferase CMT2-like [Cynara cardunculus var. scolymus]
MFTGKKSEPCDEVSRTNSASKMVVRGSTRMNSDINVAKWGKFSTTGSDALALTLHSLSSDFYYNSDESPVPLKVYDPSLAHGKSVRRSPRFTMGESIITTKGASKNKSVLGERVEGSSSGRSSRLSSSTALIVGTLDRQRSPKSKALPRRRLRRSPRLSPVTSHAENAGSNKLKRLPQKCLRRSPRLSPIPSCPQIEWEGLHTRVKGERTTDGPKLKRIKSCVEELNSNVVTEKCTKKSSARVQHGNGNCEKLAVPALSSAETVKDDFIPNGDTARPCGLEFHVRKKEDSEVKSTSIRTHDKKAASVGNIDFGYNKAPPVRCKTSVSSTKQQSSTKKQRKLKRASFFVGEPVPEDEAQERWHWRYELKGQRRKGQSWILNAGEEDELHLNVMCHYLQANVDGCIYRLGDCARIKGEGKREHVGRIVEFFKTSDDENYFRVQWFFRAEDTVMKQAAAFHEKKRLFSSTLMNDNLLDCILSKVKITEKAPALGLQSAIQPSEYYCDMEYSVKYSTFRSLATATNSLVARCDLTLPSSLDANNVTITTTPLELSSCEPYKAELALLDLYAGCGGMSTGLCLGAKISGVKLVTRWAIDYHKSACDSFKQNHPETQVRHITAEDFLELLKEWEKLCKLYVLNDTDRGLETSSNRTKKSIIRESSLLDAEVAPGEYEVSSLVDICYGDPSSTGKHGLKFKVRWKGYSPSEDTWELIQDLSDCQGHIKDFVRSGYMSKILPRPGEVDVICGGPPCQGISGYNRFRNTDDPLTDERNQQIIVFFDIVNFLKPKYALMENVADILRYDKASLGRYAISRLVHMNYQSRLGIMAAGSYGLPQFRLRVFLWGALSSETLPQFPLPTHEVIVRYFPSAEFEQNTVAYDEGQPRELKEATVLRDAISDLPAVTSHEDREEMAYDMPPETEFQKYIRLTKDEINGSTLKGVTDWRSSVLTDHRPYKLSEDDFHRVCHVPRRKGANFRDFPGLVVGADNLVRRDPTKEPVLLPSGRPLVPDYVFTFEKGKSKRPFSRIWWDENVPTVVTFPNLHSQRAIHPEQDRVLTIREYARLQGFPDHYRFCGTVKERYCQVGNAVAVFVSKTLGYALGMAFQKLSGDEALMTLPPDFAFQVPPLDQFSAQL